MEVPGKRLRWLHGFRLVPDFCCRCRQRVNDTGDALPGRVHLASQSLLAQLQRFFLALLFQLLELQSPLLRLPDCNCKLIFSLDIIHGCAYCFRRSVSLANRLMTSSLGMSAAVEYRGDGSASAFASAR